MPSKRRSPQPRWRLRRRSAPPATAAAGRVPRRTGWRAPDLVAADNLAGDPPINGAAAIASTGEVVAAWGSALQLSNAGPGDAVVPRVAADDGGNAMAAWYQVNGTRNDIWVRRFSGGSWDSARTIGDNLGDAARVSIAMDPSGRAVAVWHQYGGTFNDIWSNRYVPGS